jgi:hypothetical protein
MLITFCAADTSARKERDAPHVRKKQHTRAKERDRLALDRSMHELVVTID